MEVGSFFHLSGITLSLIGQSRKGKGFKEPMRTRTKHVWPALGAGKLVPFYHRLLEVARKTQAVQSLNQFRPTFRHSFKTPLEVTHAPTKKANDVSAIPEAVSVYLVRQF